MNKFRTLYWIYGLAIIGLLAMAEYNGWSMTDVDEVKNVPKTVRDNPGAYRAHYRSHARYFGGK
jgi:hypothetical protein